MKYYFLLSTIILTYKIYTKLPINTIDGATIVESKVRESVNLEDELIWPVFASEITALEIQAGIETENSLITYINNPLEIIDKLIEIIKNKYKNLKEFIEFQYHKLLNLILNYLSSIGLNNLSFSSALLEVFLSDSVAFIKRHPGLIDVYLLATNNHPKFFSNQSKIIIKFFKNNLDLNNKITKDIKLWSINNPQAYIEFNITLKYLADKNPKFIGEIYNYFLKITEIPPTEEEIPHKPEIYSK